ncbi:MAG: Penicillin G acylase [Fimbriimonadaceae bacterium]|nr:Penicillin G acylase [Fimbriimonadaceae bacterium]
MTTPIVFLAASVIAQTALQAPQTIERDSFGVPHILASTWAEAYETQGYAVAQDRLWQLETSRRVALGKMAEVFGASFAKADRDRKLLGYTNEEIANQIAGMSAIGRDAFRAYARGVNRYIGEAKSGEKLPKGYADNGFDPEPWTEIDSAAIAIQMAQIFGGGGAGELRNLAFYQYMVGKVGQERVLDVVDDFLFRADKRSIPTTTDTTPFPAIFGGQGRKVLEEHVKAVPKPNLLELAPALSLALREEELAVAEQVAAPFHTGSYAIVVGKEKSKLGFPLLLSGPQMGFSNPSIIHECSLTVGDRFVVGMDVPGVPGVVVGHNNDIAWGLTTGVLDSADIFVSPMDGDGYLYGKERRPLERITFEVKVKGADSQKVEQLRTHYGPVLLRSNSTKSYFSRSATWWGRELLGFESILGIPAVKTTRDVLKTTSGLPVGFNFFWATRTGDIGWRYCGITPVRSPKVDPRFPTPGDPEHDWTATRDAASLVTVVNPKSGLIANWNNKPTPWWENGDTPVWGAIFRNAILLDRLKATKLGVPDLEMAIWGIARADDDAAFLMPFIREAMTGYIPTGDLAKQAAPYLLAHDGMALGGSISERLYREMVQAVREELFLATTGNMLSMDLFNQAAQPSLMLNALQGKTKVGYRGKRTNTELVRAAFEKAVARLTERFGPEPSLWGWNPPSIPVTGEDPIPYSNRGSYIQIVELGATLRGRNVLPPGVAESGPHAKSQAALARAWGYKPMHSRLTFPPRPR